MKILISVLAGVAAFCFGFWVDAQLIHWTLSQFPPSAAEWLGVIKIGLWLFTFGVTFTISIYLGLIVGGLLATVFEVSEKNNRNKIAKTRLQELIEKNNRKS